MVASSTDNDEETGGTKSKEHGNLPESAAPRRDGAAEIAARMSTCDLSDRTKSTKSKYKKLALFFLPCSTIASLRSSPNAVEGYLSSAALIETWPCLSK